MVNPIPDGYPRISPGLSVDGAEAAIAFYTEIFGMTERMRVPMGDRIGHAELQLGDALIMVADEFPEMDFVSPKRIGGTPVNMNIHVEDVDAIFAAALEAGATQLQPVENQFYGDRSGTIEDPWGHRWHISTHVEDIDEEEMQRRSAAAMAEFGGS